MASIRYRQRGVKKQWSYEIRDESGRTLTSQGGFETKRKAQLAGSPVFQEIQKGTSLNRDMTLPQLYQHWYELKIKNSKRSKSTLLKYRWYQQKIEEYLDYPIHQITPTFYQKQLNVMGQSISRDFLGRLTNAVRKALQMAKGDKILVDDFTLGAEYFSERSGKGANEKYLHKQADLNRVLDKLQEKMDYHTSVVPYFLYLLFTTGMRPGELLALTWDHVDFDKQLLYTDCRVNSTTLEIVPPKTERSVRYVPINQASVEVLRELQQEQDDCNWELGINNDHRFVFQHYGLKKSIPNNATCNKALRKILTELSIEPMITIYGARHTRASHLISSGVPLDVVATVLGHSVEELIRTYRHLLSETRESGFDQIKNL